MEQQACTEERFLKDISNHSIQIIKDDGVYRHVSFTHNGSSVYRFDLITWPGYLCYCGDMGEYVFNRLEDMFEFFRNKNSKSDDALRINPGYWSEKLQAEPRGSEFGQEWSDAAFKQSVNDYISANLDEADTAEEADSRNEIVNEITDQIKDIYHKEEASEFINNFECSDFTFSDFWEYDCKEYTFRFLWCCYAIAWGIKQYDALKAEKKCGVCNGTGIRESASLCNEWTCEECNSTCTQCKTEKCELIDESSLCETCYNASQPKSNKNLTAGSKA